MQVELPAELKPFIEQEFASGRYAARKEVVLQALRWLRKEREDAVLGIQEGLNDAGFGRTQPLAEVFVDIRKAAETFGEE